MNHVEFSVESLEFLFPHNEMESEPPSVQFVVVASHDKQTFALLDREKQSGRVCLFDAWWIQPGPITCAQEFAFDNLIVDSEGDNDYVPIYGPSVERLRHLLGIEACNFSYDETSELWILRIPSMYFDRSMETDLVWLPFENASVHSSEDWLRQIASSSCTNLLELPSLLAKICRIDSSAL